LESSAHLQGISAEVEEKGGEEKGGGKLEAESGLRVERREKREERRGNREQ
jgi:hypothetical protein